MNEFMISKMSCEIVSQFDMSAVSLFVHTDHGTSMLSSIVQDIQLSGHTLAQICRAGGWRSNAILKCLDECELEDE